MTVEPAGGPVPPETPDGSRPVARGTATVVPPGRAAPAVRAVARVVPVSRPPVTGRAAVAGSAVVPASPPPGPAREGAPPLALAREGAPPLALARDGAPPPSPAEDVIERGQSRAAPAPKTDVRSMWHRLGTRSRRAVLPVAAALVAAFVAATGYLMTQQPRATGDVGRWTGAPPSAAAADAAPFAVPADGATPDPFGPREAAPTGVPTRLTVAAIGVDTPLETLRTGPDGEVTAPVDFARAGFYADGTLPGDTGPAVIAGHVDSRRGPAVFFRLRELTRGDRIEVVRGGSTLTFTVTATAWYPKDDFPTDRVYAPTPDRQLRLITCGGVFDRNLRSYRDNLVVYAVAG